MNKRQENNDKGKRNNTKLNQNGHICFECKIKRETLEQSLLCYVLSKSVSASETVSAILKQIIICVNPEQNLPFCKMFDFVLIVTSAQIHRPKQIGNISGFRLKNQIEYKHLYFCRAKIIVY